MLEFQSKLTYDSATPGCEGVKFTIRRLSRVQRARRDAALVQHRVRLSELQAEFSRLPADPIAPVVEPLGTIADIESGVLKEGRELKDSERAEIERLRADIARIEAEARERAKDPEVTHARLERSRINHEIDLIAEEYLIPATLRAGLISIEGIVVNGAPVTTAEGLIESGPDDLITEIETRINAASGLSAEQLKNWQSPVISHGQAVSSTANSASEPVITAA